MLPVYLERGFSELFTSILVAIIIIPLFLGVKVLLRKKDSITVLNTMVEVAWLAIVIAILSITGILGADFGVTSLFEGTSVISFNFLTEGITTATILNVILFIPFGFLSTIVFKRIQSKWIYGVAVGFAFTAIIEFLQSFTGRLVQIDDIVMNTLGAYIGYMLCVYILNFKPLKKFKLMNE